MATIALTEQDIMRLKVIIMDQNKDDAEREFSSAKTHLL